MLLSDFPQEIIEKFADFLSLKDKTSCSLVCKSWRRVFQDLMHSDLAIERQEILNDIADSSRDKQHGHHKTGHLVRYLSISYFLNIADKELYALQNTFPNVKYLEFRSNPLTLDNFGITADWNIWGSLREFRFSIFNSSIPDIKDRFIEIILCLPLLRRLEMIDKTPQQDLIPLSLNDVETIHSHLKHLSHLGLSSNLLTLSDIDLERMAKLSSAANIRRLSITSNEMDHRWLCYFARKYPNLHTLDFNIRNFLPNTEEQRDNTIALFQQVPLPFQRLTRLNLEYFNCAGKEYLLFWDISNFPSIPLKHISIKLSLNYMDYSPDNRCDIPKKLAEICLTEFTNTIESFHFDLNGTHMTPIDFMEINVILYNLVGLDLTDCCVPIELDTLLRAVPRLKSLSFYSVYINVKDEVYNSEVFGLRTFTIESSAITSDVLQFLSFRCRHLGALVINESSVYGSFTSPGCQFIDMEYSRLALLYINMSRFIIQENLESLYNSNITIITRPVDDIPPKQDYDPKALPVVIGDPTKTHYDCFQDMTIIRMYPISETQGSEVEKFALNYEENKRIATERSLDTKRGQEYIRWNKQLAFGHTKIKFGYVVDCRILYVVF